MRRSVAVNSVTVTSLSSTARPFVIVIVVALCSSKRRSGCWLRIVGCIMRSRVVVLKQLLLVVLEADLLLSARPLLLTLVPLLVSLRTALVIIICNCTVT